MDKSVEHQKLEIQELESVSLCKGEAPCISSDEETSPCEKEDGD
jgi:hypothetical protein